MAAEVAGPMIKLTWEWLGQGPALDLADTVAIENGSEHDFLASAAGYEGWADAEAAFLPPSLASLLRRSRPQLTELRTAIRQALAAVAAGDPPPEAAVAKLNRVSAAAPRWVELDPLTSELHEVTSGSATDRLLAWYARSAIELLAEQGGRVRRCPAPSCGMFYLSTRRSQRWCSTQCGSRARVARHYARHEGPGRERTL